MQTPFEPQPQPRPRPRSSSLLDSLYREHRVWLLARVRRHADSAHAAEDVVGEAFVQLAQHRALHEVREPRALLITIAKRVLFDTWRRRDLERAALDELAHTQHAVQGSPLDHLLVGESLRAVDAALIGLPVKARQAFLCSQLHGQTYAQIAGALGVSASMVRQYMARATAAVLEAAGTPQQLVGS